MAHNLGMDHVDMETRTVIYDKKRIKCRFDPEMKDLRNELSSCNRARIKRVLLDKMGCVIKSQFFLHIYDRIYFLEILDLDLNV